MVQHAAASARRPLAAGIAHCCANLTCTRLRCPLLCAEGSWSGMCAHTCEQQLCGVSATQDLAARPVRCWQCVRELHANVMLRALFVFQICR